MTSDGIAVESLSKSFEDEVVLRDIDLRVQEGDLCAIVGPSGCGKSTLLGCIAGLVEYEDGTIRVENQDVKHVPIEERDIGLVFQEFEETLFPHMTVGENIRFGLEQQGLPEEEITVRIDDVLELLAIPETRDNRPEELSGGQQQRVELARQLVRRCDVMLLDDPLSDLDYKLQKRMELELHQLHTEQEGTFVYVTHNQDQALKLAGSIAVMNQGRIEQVGPPDEVYSRPATAFVGRFVGDSNLFGCRPMQTDGNRVLVETDVGEIDATLPEASVGDEVSVVLVRPENVYLGSDARERDNQLTGTLRDRTYTGERTEYVATVEGFDQELLVIERGRTSHTPGQEIEIGWDAADTRAFDQLSATESVTVDDLRKM